MGQHAQGLALDKCIGRNEPICGEQKENNATGNKRAGLRFKHRSGSGIHTSLARSALRASGL